MSDNAQGYGGLYDDDYFREEAIRRSAAVERVARILDALTGPIDGHAIANPEAIAEQCVDAVLTDE